MNKHIKYYKEQYNKGEIKVSKYVVMLFDYLDKHVLNRDDIYFDNEMHDNYIKFTEKHYFPLQPFQKFITAFVFLYYKDGGHPFFAQFFLYMARGAGKNGLISSLVHFLISDLHGIDNYNVSIVANSEQQAKTSFNEVYDIIDMAEDDSALRTLFNHKKAEIKGTNGSTMKYHTSNAKTKDSLRDGCVIYDEVHEYADSQIVDVFSSGLGKVKHAREFFITTDGFVRGGYLDDMKKRAINVLKGEALDDHLFVFMATLDEDSEMDDEDNWQKANPMFNKPLTPYAEELFRTVKRQYVSLGNSKPSARIRFMTKRMNSPAEDLETSVATWDEIEATNKPFPDLENKSCIGGIDFASIRDFLAVGLLFKIDGEYIWKTHSFARKGFLDNVELKPPIYEWQEQGLLTIVDEPVISVQHAVDWFVSMRERYGLKTIVADTYRLDLVKSALEAEGFEIMYIRTKGIESLLAPRIETMFAERKVTFGDNPLMRWYTNNVTVTMDKKGNKTYGKKDENRRKTDGFHAFIHALYRDDLIEEEVDFMLSGINF